MYDDVIYEDPHGSCSVQCAKKIFFLILYIYIRIYIYIYFHVLARQIQIQSQSFFKFSVCTKKLIKIKVRKKSVLTSKYSFWVQNRVTSFMKTPMAPAWCSVPKIITCQEVIFALKFSSFGVFQGVFPCLTTKSTFLFI